MSRSRPFISGNNGELGFMNFKAVSPQRISGAATNTGDGSADFFLGLPGEFGGVLARENLEQTSNVYGAYAQDTWRVQIDSP